jgi:hypothetical protein
MMENHKKYVYFVDKNKFETSASQLSVSQIMADAKIDPSENILVLVQGGQNHELTDLGRIIELKEGMHFTVFSKKPTPVSCK